MSAKYDDIVLYKLSYNWCQGCASELPMYVVCIGPLRYNVFDLVVIDLFALIAQFVFDVHTASASDLKTTHVTLTRLSFADLRAHTVNDTAEYSDQSLHLL